MMPTRDGLAGLPGATMSSLPEGGSRPPATEPIFEVFCPRHFTGWLAEARPSLCFTTYQAASFFYWVSIGMAGFPFSTAP
jgi:hypothetical protein